MQAFQWCICPFNYASRALRSDAASIMPPPPHSNTSIFIANTKINRYFFNQNNARINMHPVSSRELPNPHLQTYWGGGVNLPSAESWRGQNSSLRQDNKNGWVKTASQHVLQMHKYSNAPMDDDGENTHETSWMNKRGSKSDTPRKSTDVQIRRNPKTKHSNTRVSDHLPIRMSLNSIVRKFEFLWYSGKTSRHATQGIRIWTQQAKRIRWWNPPLGDHLPSLVGKELEGTVPSSSDSSRPRPLRAMGHTGGPKNAGFKWLPTLIFEKGGLVKCSLLLLIYFFGFWSRSFLNFFRQNPWRGISIAFGTNLIFQREKIRWVQHAYRSGRTREAVNRFSASDVKKPCTTRRHNPD